MTRKTAGLVFVGICIVIADLLVTKAITPLVGGILFAITLVVLGLLSGGFRRT